MSLLLDLANIIGGLLLATPLLRRLPRVGAGIGQVADRVAPWGWIIGIVALVAGGFYLIVHIFSGPHPFHFEIVGIAVGVLLAWERLTTRRPITTSRHGEPTGAVMVIAIFGMIAVLVGLQGLVTPG
ncbi:hypothetical protein Ari01nite_26550 [Paractinoplanes rishiriensis]|uniref:Uncharacterized protein n=2 Tax=Paractinoplanes rishiriensis TaxID=1050105 RepID=A0A919JUS6_9ACTN|nr:hypothetical protein Ari01nite_26550 [Actinoplanes rishiriensis]